MLCGPPIVAGSKRSRSRFSSFCRLSASPNHRYFDSHGTGQDKTLFYPMMLTLWHEVCLPIFKARGKLIVSSRITNFEQLKKRSKLSFVATDSQPSYLDLTLRTHTTSCQRVGSWDSGEFFFNPCDVSQDVRRSCGGALCKTDRNLSENFRASFTTFFFCKIKHGFDSGPRERWPSI